MWVEAYGDSGPSEDARHQGYPASPGAHHYLVGPLQLYGASLVAHPRIEVRKQRLGAAKGERLAPFKYVCLKERVHPGPVRGNNQLVVAQQGLRQTVQGTTRGFQAAL